jgi:hypothetical protein
MYALERRLVLRDPQGTGIRLGVGGTSPTVVEGRGFRMDASDGTLEPFGSKEEGRWLKGPFRACDVTEIRPLRIAKQPSSVARPASTFVGRAF